MTEEIPVQSTETEMIVSIDDKEQTKTNENKKESIFKNSKTKLDLFDKKISKKIHNLELNTILENIIYIFARLFNADIITIFYISLLLYQSFFNKNYYYIIKPVIHVIVVFILTGLLKYSFKRPRPEINKNVKRIYNIRKKENNFAMPSGDSMQAANFAVITLFYFNLSFCGFLLLPFVMFARIFYFCHYFFDTLIGALVGGGVSLGLVFPLKFLKL